MENALNGTVSTTLEQLVTSACKSLAMMTVGRQGSSYAWEASLLMHPTRSGAGTRVCPLFTICMSTRWTFRPSSIDARRLSVAALPEYVEAFSRVFYQAQHMMQCATKKSGCDLVH
jgi:hypothetical protein